MTGRTRYRVLTRRWRKPVLILQIEETRQVSWYGCCPDDYEVRTVVEWRDATIEDITSAPPPV